MTRTILLAFLLPLAARAQIALYTVNNGAETPIGASLDLGKVAAGDTVSVRIRVRNIGTKTANITYFFVGRSRILDRTGRRCRSRWLPEACRTPW